MKKRIIGIVFAAVLVLLLGVSFAGCKPDRSEIEEGIYSFREAYEIAVDARRRDERQLLYDWKGLRRKGNL